MTCGHNIHFHRNSSARNQMPVMTGGFFWPWFDCERQEGGSVTFYSAALRVASSSAALLSACQLWGHLQLSAGIFTVDLRLRERNHCRCTIPSSALLSVPCKSIVASLGERETTTVHFVRFIRGRRGMKPIKRDFTSPLKRHNNTAGTQTHKAALTSKHL